MSQDRLLAILDLIIAGDCAEADLEVLKQALSNRDEQLLVQLGKYNVSLGEAKDIHIGDRNYVEIDDKAIQTIVEAIQATGEVANFSSNLSIEDAEELLSLLKKRCCKKNQACDNKTQLFNKQHLELKHLYVPSFLTRSCRSQRLGVSEKVLKVSIKKAIDSHNHIAIIGPPGIGKSTILNFVSIKECEESSPYASFYSDPDEYVKSQDNLLPVLIRLREVSSSKVFSLTNELERILEVPYQQLEFVLRSGKLLLLVDGLDEIANDFREQICNELNDFARSYQENKVILTCRSSVDFPASESFGFFEVATLNRDQQKKFIDNYFSLGNKDSDNWLGNLLKEKEELSSQKLYWKIQASDRLRELAQTPLLLSMMCLVYIHSGSLPEKRSTLYKQGVEIYLDIWDKHRTSRAMSQSEPYQSIGSRKKKSILEELAYHKFSQESNYTQFSEDEIVTFISEYSVVTEDEGLEILNGIASDHGLLVEMSSGQWEFSHLTFHEYFSAQWILKNKKWGVLVEKITNEKWKEVIRLVAESQPMGLEWFKCAKKRVDSLVAHNDKLQTLLSIAASKAKTLDISDNDYPYSQSSTRAFYYELALDFSLINERGASLHYNYYYKLSHTLDNKISRALEAQYELDFVHDAYSEADIIEYNERRLLDPYEDHYEIDSKTSAQIEKLRAEADKLNEAYRDMSQELYRELLYDSNTLEAILGFTNALRNGRSVTESVKDYKVFSSNGTLSRNENPYTPLVDVSKEYKAEMSRLFDSFSSLKSISEVVAWTKKLLSLLMEERSIAHIYRLNDEERAEAQKYYKTNVYLIELMKIPGATTDAQRAELSNTVLLPFVGLQKEYPDLYTL